MNKSGLKYLYKNRDLIWQFTQREIEAKHKGSSLGSLWALISPLLMLGLYLIVFGLIFGGRFGVIPVENFYDFAIALFLGLALFNVIADVITSSPNYITSQPNFVKKVVFPLEIIAISKIAASFYFALLSVGIAIILAPFSHGGLTVYALQLPIILIPLGMIALGLSWSLCSIGVFFKDLNHTTGFLATTVMYASAIVYSPNKLPHPFNTILKYNPILLIIDHARRVLFWRQAMQINELVTIYILSLIILIIGYLIFRKLRPYFAELL